MLVSPLAKQIPRLAGYAYAGVDAGALRCMEQGISMAFALGDFDSDETALAKIRAQTECYILPCKKNETDMESAVAKAKEQGYAPIVLYGVLQGRFDHTMANLHLLLYRDASLQLMDENNHVQVLGKGRYRLLPTYRYLSFLALEDSCISEQGVAYPLHRQPLSPRDIYPISNEIIEAFAVIEVHAGRVLCIQSNDLSER